MPIHDDYKGPAHEMQRLMQAEAARESRRLGLHFDAPADRLTVSAPSPGVLYFRRGHGGGNEVSFAVAMALLAGLPDHAGSSAVSKVLDKAARDPSGSPYPPNDPAWLQVGDLIGGGRVSGIRSGHSYDTAKNGDDVRSVPRRALLAHASAERIIVIVDGPDGGWWRRGTQLSGHLRKPAAEGREQLARLRRDHAALGRILRDERAKVVRENGDPERLLAYAGMLAASRRMLDVVHRPDASPLRGEVLHLRRLRDDLRTLGTRIDRDSPLGKAAVAVDREAKATGLRYAAARRAEVASLAPERTSRRAEGDAPRR
jgi:hypothetical protein